MNPYGGEPIRKDCPHCTASNYMWQVTCRACGQRMQPAMVGSGAAVPIVLAATDDSVDDLPPGKDSKAYTLKVGRHTGVAERGPNYEYLARWRADLLAGEAAYGLGVDTLACQYETIYSRARLAAGLRR